MTYIILNIARELVLYTGRCIGFYGLFKDNFKYRGGVVIILFFLANLARSNTPDTIFPLCFSVWLLYSMFEAFVFKENIINCYTLRYVFDICANAIGNAFIIVAFAVKSLFFGSETGWITRDSMGTGIFVLMIVAMIPVYYITYRLCLKIKEHLLALKGWLKYFCFVTVPLLGIMLDGIRLFAYDGYNNDPRGIGFILDCVNMCTGLILAAVMFAMEIRRKKKENAAIIESIEADYRVICEQMQVQQQIREIKHDLKNYMISHSNESKEEIIRYCQNVMKGTGEADDRQC